MITIRFSALDTWFFRESRPMDTVGGSELASVFPPPARTLLGAVRTAIGDAEGVDWRQFARDGRHPLRARIGFGDDLGPLALQGPWICKGEERLYPVPSFLMEKTTGDARHLRRLRIGKAADTYLGRVRLPELPEGAMGFKPLDGAWLPREDLEQVLAGHLPDPTGLCRARDLFAEEPRLGIARDNARRTSDDGLLYQTRHLRPRSGVGFEADLTLPADTPISDTLVRLGGEGRIARLAALGASPIRMPVAPQPHEGTRGLILVLLTGARLGSGPDAWLPPGFQPKKAPDDTQVWEGELAGTRCNGAIGRVRLILHAAVLGKVAREGGWNLAEQRPRPVQSLIPAGSAYYVTVAGDEIARAMETLHGAQIGEDLALGRGLVACALWNANEF